MGVDFAKHFWVSCISVGFILGAALPAAADNEVKVQDITWVKPSRPLQAAVPTQAEPEVLDRGAAKPAVRQAGRKASHPTPPPKAKTKKADAQVNVPEPEAVTPLFPDKVPLSQVITGYYGCSQADVDKAFSTYGISDDALVALFMANAAHARLDRIIALRLGNSWKNVIGFLQLNTKYLFHNLQVGRIPKENTRNCMSYIQFNAWRDDPDFRDLGDLSVRELVGASLLDNRYHLGPLEALRQVHECGGAINALSNYTELK